MTEQQPGTAARRMAFWPWPRYCMLVLALLALAWTARAENLMRVQQQGLPPLPDQVQATTLMVIAERLVAGDQHRLWWFDRDEHAWRGIKLTAGQALDPLHLTSSAGHTWRILEPRGWLEQIETLNWQADALHLTRMEIPPMPLRQVHLAVLADTLYMAGIDADGVPNLWSRSLAGTNAHWQAHPGWPGSGAPQSLVAQKFALYLTIDTGVLWRWTPAQGWAAHGPIPDGMAGVGQAIGQAHVLYLPHPDRDAMTRRPHLFHTITKTWIHWPADIPGPGTSLWRHGHVWLSPDGNIHSTQLQTGQHLLNWLDWTVIVIYLLAMLGIGGYFYLKDQTRSESDFFMGGRSIPFWAAGISLYATNTSSISFIAIPAKAYETNWQYLTNNLIAVLGLMFVAVWIVPLLRRLDLMSVFSYLEMRFHPAIRMLASALAIAMQVGSRLSVILFLPALAIAAITGIDVIWSILIMGVFSILYTVMGGMRAVIWTDFVQVLVMMGGAVFAIIFIAHTLGHDLGDIREAVALEDKTRLLDFSFDLTQATVWGFIFLVLFDVVLTAPKDQVLMQRTLATRSVQDAGRSIWIFAAIMIPGGCVFYSIGTALWMYYKAHPERLDPLLPIDATFPLFIAAELPSGITGLIIAGIFAAAMSTLSSIINSVATLLSVDFYAKLAKRPTEAGSVRFAKWMVVIVGLLGMGLALVLSGYDIHSLFDLSIELTGLLGGGFAGAYTLGMFTRRANAKGVMIGIASSIGLTLLAWTFDLVHPYFYLGISIMLCILIGWLASLCFPPPQHSLKGLTIHTRPSSSHGQGV